MSKLIQITAYVRNEEDLAKWKTIANKTEWLHIALNTSMIEMAVNQTPKEQMPEHITRATMLPPTSNEIAANVDKAVMRQLRDSAVLQGSCKHRDIETYGAYKVCRSCDKKWNVAVALEPTITPPEETA